MDRRRAKGMKARPDEMLTISAPLRSDRQAQKGAYLSVGISIRLAGNGSHTSSLRLRAKERELCLAEPLDVLSLCILTLSILGRRRGRSR